MTLYYGSVDAYFDIFVEADSPEEALTLAAERLNASGKYVNEYGDVTDCLTIGVA